MLGVARRRAPSQLDRRGREAARPDAPTQLGVVQLVARRQGVDGDLDPAGRPCALAERHPVDQRPQLAGQPSGAEAHRPDGRAGLDEHHRSVREHPVAALDPVGRRRRRGEHSGGRDPDVVTLVGPGRHRRWLGPDRQHRRPLAAEVAGPAALHLGEHGVGGSGRPVAAHDLAEAVVLILDHRHPVAQHLFAERRDRVHAAGLAGGPLGAGLDEPVALQLGEGAVRARPVALADAELEHLAVQPVAVVGPLGQQQQQRRQHEAARGAKPNRDDGAAPAVDVTHHLPAAPVLGRPSPFRSPGAPYTGPNRGSTGHSTAIVSEQPATRVASEASGHAPACVATRKTVVSERATRAPARERPAAACVATQDRRERTSDRAPARERPAAACVAGERSDRWQTHSLTGRGPTR